MVVADAEAWPCADCGVDTQPWEQYMVLDSVWKHARAVEDGCAFLCVECLEGRLGRLLEPDDFSAVPLNDDCDVDSVRLRMRKGSGRQTEPLYGVAVRAVLDAGGDPALLAGALGLDREMLGVWLDHARVARSAARVTPLSRLRAKRGAA